MAVLQFSLYLLLVLAGIIFCIVHQSCAKFTKIFLLQYFPTYCILTDKGKVFASFLIVWVLYIYRRFLLMHFSLLKIFSQAMKIFSLVSLSLVAMASDE